MTTTTTTTFPLMLLLRSYHRLCLLCCATPSRSIRDRFTDERRSFNSMSATQSGPIRSGSAVCVDDFGNNICRPRPTQGKVKEVRQRKHPGSVSSPPSILSRHEAALVMGRGLCAGCGDTVGRLSPSERRFSVLEDPYLEFVFFSCKCFLALGPSRY